MALRGLDAFMPQEITGSLLPALIAGVIYCLCTKVVKPEFFYCLRRIPVCFHRGFSCTFELITQGKCGKSLAPFIDQRRSGDLMTFLIFRPVSVVI